MDRPLALRSRDGHSPERLCADAGNNRVLKWTPGSTAAIPIAEFAGRLNEPRGVAVDVDSNIYVADSGSGQVLKLEANSGAIEKLPFTHLKTPAAVAVDDAESVYVADDNIPHVSKLTQTSQTDIFTYPPTVLGGPPGLAVDSNSSVRVRHRLSQRPGSQARRECAFAHPGRVH
jgi:streptogramin lyase